MRKRDVVQTREGNPIQPVRYIESTLTHAVELEVRANLILIDSILSVLRFLEVITPVPARSLEGLPLLTNLGLYVVEFFLCLNQSRSPDLV